LFGSESQIDEIQKLRIAGVTTAPPEAAGGERVLVQPFFQGMRATNVVRDRAPFDLVGGALDSLQPIAFLWKF
jgi:hypothetical protein